MANGSGGSPGTSVTSKVLCLPEAFTPSTPVLTLTERAVAGRGAVRVLTRIGGRFALPATGVGLVLLAHAPAEVQEEVLSGPLRSFTEETIVDPGHLRRVLAGVRRDGYAVSAQQVTMDAVSVAAPIFGPDRGVVASVSLVVRAEGARPRALAPTVRATARGISRALGAPRGTGDLRDRPERPGRRLFHRTLV